MLASDVWIEQLAILSHEDACNSVDPMSSEDVAVVVDFNCRVHRLPPGGDLLHEHVESSASIFNHCWRERYSSDCWRFSLNLVQRDIRPHRQSQLSELTIRLHITTFLNSIITETVTLSPNTQMDVLTSSTLSTSINQCDVTNRSSSSLVKSPSADIPLW